VNGHAGEVAAGVKAGFLEGFAFDLVDVREYFPAFCEQQLFEMFYIGFA